MVGEEIGARIPWGEGMRGQDPAGEQDPALWGGRTLGKGPSPSSVASCLAQPSAMPRKGRKGPATPGLSEEERLLLMQQKLLVAEEQSKKKEDVLRQFLKVWLGLAPGGCSWAWAGKGNHQALPSPSAAYDL